MKLESKILIIGSEGFIGKSASLYFSNLGYNVYNADIVNLNRENYFYLKTDISNLDELFIKNDFCVCINASGSASVPNSFHKPNLDFEANVLNVHKILNVIRSYNINCKFINFSSAAVYGNPEINPIKESSNLNPISPYGFHKVLSESICKEFNEIYGINTISLRVFSVYGVGSRKQLFWDLYNKIESNNYGILELLGTGCESRDFIFIDDLLDALYCIIKNAKFNGEAINIANGEEIFIKDAVSIFVQLYKPTIKIIFSNKSRTGDPSNWKADISLLKSMGYNNTHSLELGLSKYTKWLRDLKK
jgi:UDP-glucose 4-epimerase